jgi:hypothetical protein
MEDRKKPRMSLVRRARTKLRRGDYDRLTPDLLEALVRGLLAERKRAR